MTATYARNYTLSVSEKSSRPKRQPNPVGRPSTYNAKLHPKLVQALAQQGLTDEQIAVELEMSEGGLYKWYKEHPELVEAKKAGAIGPDQQVVNALFKRATGYVIKKQVVVRYKTSQYTEDVKAIDVDIEVPGDVTAEIYWTKNRLRAQWRDSWQESTPIGNTSPLAVVFPDSIAATDLVDPEKQDNLEIGEGSQVG